MLRDYPVESVSSAPGTGRLLYDHLMKHIHIPATANHDIWYAGEEAKLTDPDTYAFRGGTPYGETLELRTLAGQDLEESDNVDATDHGTFLYTFPTKEDYIVSGENEVPVYAGDLSTAARKGLGIPETAREEDKVFNPNFRTYDELDPFTKYSNELASLSLPKSLSSWWAGLQGKVNYSEADVLSYLDACFDNLSGPEMTHLMHGNNMAWSALAYIRERGAIEGDLMKEFHAQNPTDFYIKDLGTLLPAMFYSLAMLGKDPVEYYERLDIEIWGAKETAEHMQGLMRKTAE